MKLERKDGKPAKVEFSVEWSVDELKPYLPRATKHISEEVKIPGFRSGHVPYDILKQRLGEAAIWEALAQVIVRETLKKILKDHPESFIGTPEVNFQKIAPQNPLAFTVVLYRLPRIKVGNYKQLKTKKQEVKIEESELQKELETLRKLRAKEALVAREAKQGDRVLVDFNIQVAGVPIEGGQAMDHALILGEGQLLKDFENHIMGMKASETKKFKLTFPKDYFQKTLAGKESDVTLKLKQVYERALPALDDAFAAQWHYQNIGSLEEEVKKRIESQKKRREEARFSDALMEEIMNASEYEELPPLLVDDEKKRMMQELREAVESSGGKWEDYLSHLKKTEDDLSKNSQKEAERRVKISLLVHELLKLEGIEKNPEKLISTLEQYTSKENVSA